MHTISDNTRDTPSIISRIPDEILEHIFSLVPVEVEKEHGIENDVRHLSYLSRRLDAWQAQRKSWSQTCKRWDMVARRLVPTFAGTNAAIDGIRMNSIIYNIVKERSARLSVTRDVQCNFTKDQIRRFNDLLVSYGTLRYLEVSYGIVHEDNGAINAAEQGARTWTQHLFGVPYSLMASLPKRLSTIFTSMPMSPLHTESRVTQHSPDTTYNVDARVPTVQALALETLAIVLKDRRGQHELPNIFAQSKILMPENLYILTEEDTKASIQENRHSCKGHIRKGTVDSLLLCLAHGKDLKRLYVAADAGDRYIDEGFEKLFEACPLLCKAFVPCHIESLRRATTVTLQHNHLESLTLFVSTVHIRPANNFRSEQASLMHAFAAKCNFPRLKTVVLRIKDYSWSSRNKAVLAVWASAFAQEGIHLEVKDGGDLNGGSDQ